MTTETIMTTETVTNAATFAERMFTTTLGALEAFSVTLGDQLGLYDGLHQHGPTTAPDLAARTGVHARYVGEWLEQQTAIGIVAVHDAAADPDQRRYELPAEHAAVLTDRDSTDFMPPFIRFVFASAIRLPELLDAYRRGTGVSWEQFGEPMRTGQAEANRPWFLGELAQRWFPSVPDLQARLDAGARVADVGCGEGWSSIAFALGYPNVTVDGFDIDQPSITMATSHASECGVDDRVAFHHADATSLADVEGGYDLVTAFECIHDLPDPVAVLAAMRRLAGEGGAVVVMDEKVGERFVGATDDPIEQLMYGLSLTICLPDAMSHAPSRATGTVMRAPVLASYAREAGFSTINELPIDNDLWRFYRLS